MIHVSQLPAQASTLRFMVTIQDALGRTQHEVSLGPDSWPRLKNLHPDPGKIVAAAFRFLLDREPGESILARFELGVIGSYFPEFERELPRYLDAGAEK